MSFKVKIYRIQKDITLGFMQFEGKKSLQEKGKKINKLVSREIDFS